jgi:hypothetical protein
MPVRSYQGKEGLASGATFTPHRGEIFVDLDTLSFRISDGVTPGGILIQGSGQQVGGSFSLLTGQISEIQIPTHLITNTMLRTDNVATSTWILSANSTGGFVWVDPLGVGGGGLGSISNVGRTGDYNDLTHLPAFKVVSTSGSFYDLLDYPTVVSAFRNDTGFLTSATLSAYVTSATLNTAVTTAVSNLVGSSGTTFAVIQQLASLLSTSTSTVSLLTNQLGNKLDISTATTYSTPQKAIGRANLGLSVVAASGDYNDLVNKPATFSIAPATQSTIGGVVIGTGLAVDNNGRISLSTTTTILNISSPATLKGQKDQIAGTLQADQNYVYMARSAFTPTGIVTASASSTSTNVIPVAASQWANQINQIGNAYQSGQWVIFDQNLQQIYNVTSVSAIGGTAYFTIDTTVTYQAATTYYIQTTDTITRIGLEDSYGTAPGGIHGSESVAVTGTVDMPQGQAYGTTSTLLTVDCTGITYGEMAISFIDSTNSEYYKGTCEIFLYPDLTYIVQPNIVGNKTDRITLGFTSGRNAPYQMTNSIKIPVYNSDKNISNNTTNSHASAGTIKYSWLVRTNI